MTSETLEPLPALTATDLPLLRWALEPAIDPAGRRIAYVVSGPDAAADRLDYHVTAHDVDRPGHYSHVAHEAMTRHPRWSSTGRLGVLAGDESGGWNFGVVDEDGVLDRPFGRALHVVDFDWSPDGRRVAMELADCDAPRSTIAIGDVATGIVSAVAGLAGASRPQWAAAGARLAVAVGNDVWLADVDGAGPPPRILNTPSRIRAVAWSPDGSRLAVLGSAPDEAPWDNAPLYAVDVASGERTALGVELDRSIGHAVRGDDERGITAASLAWTPDGSTVLAVVANGGTSAVVRFGGEGATTVIATHPAILEFAAGADGSIAYTWSDAVTPGEVSVLGADGCDRTCSDLAAPLRLTRSLAPSSAVRAGHVEGWLTRPGDGHAAVPLVVHVHGGPHYPVGERFCFDSQRFAGIGLATLRLNPRGSQGYGVAHAEAVAGDWGGVDAEDVETLITAVAGLDEIDATRVGLVGESYGGFLVLALAAGRERFRYRAVVAENAVGDLLAVRSVNPMFWDAELALHEPGAEARAAMRSPLTSARDLTAPLLLLRAADDHVVPPAQSEDLLAAVRAAGNTDVELISVEGEDHFVNVFGRPSRRIAKLHAVDAFLSAHLDPAGRHGDSLAAVPGVAAR